MIIRILNFLFGEVEKDGKCKPWNHVFPEWKTSYKHKGTGQYLNGEEITKKYWYEYRYCSKCNKYFKGDDHTYINF